MKCYFRYLCSLFQESAILGYHSELTFPSPPTFHAKHLPRIFETSLLFTFLKHPSTGLWSRHPGSSGNHVCANSFRSGNGSSLKGIVHVLGKNKCKRRQEPAIHKPSDSELREARLEIAPADLQLMAGRFNVRKRIEGR
jgi:hypothetical protein